MNVKRTISVVAAIGLVTLTIAVLLKRKGPSQPSTVTQVTFRLDWAPGAEHSFLYLAQQRGYFEKEKLAVTIEAGDGSTTSAKLVGNGTVNYALCSGDTALIAASADVPIRVLAVLYSRTPAVVYSRKDRNITKPKDLEGHKYGAFMKSTTYNQFLAFCGVAGVDLAKVQVMPTAGKAEDILTDGVDASGAYTYIQPIQCELAGVPVNEIPMADYGQRSEQTTTFLRDLRKFLLSSLDVVAERKMKSVQRNRVHTVEVFAEVPGSVVDFPIRESP